MWLRRHRRRVEGGAGTAEEIYGHSTYTEIKGHITDLGRGKRVEGVILLQENLHHAAIAAPGDVVRQTGGENSPRGRRHERYRAPPRSPGNPSIESPGPEAPVKERSPVAPSPTVRHVRRGCDGFRVSAQPSRLAIRMVPDRLPAGTKIAKTSTARVAANDGTTKLAHRRMTVPEPAERPRNVGGACRRGGMARTGSDDWKRRFASEGPEGLGDRPPVHERHPQPALPAASERILML